MALANSAPVDSARDHYVLLAISRAAQAVQRTHTTDEVYSTVGAQIISLGGQAAIYLLTQDREHLALAYLSLQLSSPPGSVPASVSGFCAPVISEQQTVFYPELAGHLVQTLPPQARPAAEQALAQLGLKHGICAPLVSGGEAYGLLAVISRSLTEADTPAVTLFANQISIALENTRLYQATRDQTAQLEAANQALHAEIAERKQAEAALSASERRFRDVALSLSDWVWEVDTQGYYIYCSERVADVLGYAIGEVLGKTPFDFMPPEEAQRVGAIFAKLSANRDPIVDLDNLNIRKDGREVRLRTNGVPVLTASGELAGYRGVDTDITSHAQAQEARQQTEAKLQESYENILALLNAPADIVLILDPQGAILSANSVFVNRFGKTLDNLIGTSVYNYLPPDVGAVRKAHADEAIRTRTVIVFEDDRAGRYFENTLYPVIDAGGQVKRLVAVAQDITQRKQAEATLRESEARYKKLLESVTSYVYTVKVEDGRPMATSHGPGCVSVTGYTADDYAADPYLWINMVYEADREAVTAQAAQVLAQEKTLPLEHRLIHKDGSLRWVSCALVARNGADGQLRAYDGMITDITARKQLEADLLAERATLAQRVEARTAELSAANAELARAMRAKDAFLATMSHELRTPLTAVMGLSEALQLEVYGPLTEKQRGSLQTIHTSGHHLLALITDILDLSKIESGKLELQMDPLVVDEICQASLGLIQEQAAKKKQHITYSVDNSVTQLRADGRRLVQILVNLLSNAVKFTPDGGQIGLEVAGDRQQQIAYFTVWDTGIGIAPDVMPSLFQPFVQLDNRLSRAYEGTGLGLALVRRLAEMHGGRVGLESEGVPGKGSRFTVSLPWKGADEAASWQGPSPLPASATLPAASGSHAPLLLVEDDEGTLIALSDFLRSRGYQVTNARSGAEAIKEAWEIGPALILMDIQMPGMNGLEAIRQLRARAETSTTPIIALTALAMPGDRERGLEAGANEYLTKPVKLGDLMRTIEGLLPPA